MTNLFACMYHGKEIQIEADSSYDAQQKAQKIFKAKKGYDIIVLPLNINGRDIIHKPMF